MTCANTQCSAYGDCNLGFDCPLFILSPTNTKRTKDKPAKSFTTEDNEQEAVIDYCALKGIEVVHIPNESKRSPSYGAKMKRIGLRKGFPDLLFPMPRKGYHGLFIELKRDRTCRPTKEQLWWIDYLNKQGYHATVCYGADEAIREMEKYFGEKHK